MMLMNSLLERMSPTTEFSSFFDESRKAAIIRGLFNSYYHQVPQDCVVFDTNRGWTSRSAILKSLFPSARIVCCVRDVSWVLDSIEMMLARNPLEISRIFGFKISGTVYGRAESMMNSESGLIGFAWSSLREAWFGPQGGELILIRYESLAQNPQYVLGRLYELLEEPPFEHDFGNVTYQSKQYDSDLAMPGMHSVSGPVRWQPRPSRLPPDLFRKYSNMNFWDNPELRRAGVIVL